MNQKVTERLAPRPDDPDQSQGQPAPAKAARAQPIISPLANEKTYGERWFSGIVDWGMNYWTNLLSSAGFSHWVEHATKPIKLPGMQAASPRKLQADFASWLRETKIPFVGLRGLKEKLLIDLTKSKAKELGLIELKTEDIALIELKAEEKFVERSMSRARGMTLLMPGFLIMIPAVWLGAKIKPWFVKTLNRMHYGDEAMDDPSLKARHQAIEAEDRPTFLGTLLARLGTMVVVQKVAQFIGSDGNEVNKLAKKYNIKKLENFGVDPFAREAGEMIGRAVPDAAQDKFNKLTHKLGMDWSAEQVTKFEKTGPYTNATNDFTRFVVADTVYTLFSAFTIRPILWLLQRAPIIGSLMRYKPNVPRNSATFDGEKIKVPTNRYLDEAETAEEKAPRGSEPGDLARAEERYAASERPNNQTTERSEHSRAHTHHQIA